MQHQMAPSTINGMNNNTSSVPDQERMRKIETFQRKQRELEATQAAEERILREAQRRKEDEVMKHRQQILLHQQQQQQQQQWQRSNAPAAAPSLRLDNLVSGGSNNASSATQVQTQLAFQSQQQIEVQTRMENTREILKEKRVSFFQDQPSVTTYDDNANQQQHQRDPVVVVQREDPDVSILPFMFCFDCFHIN